MIDASRSKTRKGILDRCSDWARRSEARPAPEMRMGLGALMMGCEADGVRVPFPQEAAWL